MSAILGPELSYVYWGRSTTFKGGDPSSDRHQAFNPMRSFPGPAGGHYEQEFVATPNVLFPNLQWDKERKEGTLPLEMYFRDPMLLLTLFPYKTVPASWTGSGDVITGAFTNNDNRDKNLWIQTHLHDHSGNGDHIEYLFDGAEIAKYEWNWGVKKPLMEKVDLAFVELDTNTQAVDIDDGFDDGSFDADGIDGGWSNWDGAFDASKGEVAHSKDVTVTFGDSQLSGIDVQEGRLVIEVPKERYWVHSSLTAKGSTMKTRKWYLELVGIILNNDQVADFLAQIGSKTTGSVRVQYGTTKYLQFTNGMTVGPPPGEIPKSGENVKGTYRIEGSANSALTFSWTANEATDPSNHINHTDS